MATTVEFVFVYEGGIPRIRRAEQCDADVLGRFSATPAQAVEIEKSGTTRRRLCELFADGLTGNGLTLFLPMLPQVHRAGRRARPRMKKLRPAVEAVMPIAVATLTEEDFGQFLLTEDAPQPAEVQ